MKTIMKKEKSCGAVIFRRRHETIQYLLIHQIQGHWCFPKGHVEGNETEHETAQREIKEETNLTVTFIDGFRYSLNYSPSEGISKDVVYFLAGYAKGKEKAQEEELQGMGWFTYDEALATITFDNDRSLLVSADHFLKQTSAA